MRARTARRRAQRQILFGSFIARACNMHRRGAINEVLDVELLRQGQHPIRAVAVHGDSQHPRELGAIVNREALAQVGHEAICNTCVLKPPSSAAVGAVGSDKGCRVR